MQIKIKTPKGIFRGDQKWTGFLDDIDKLLKEFFNAKRLDDLAEIVKQDVIDNLDSERKPDGGALRALKPSTLRYKKTGKKLFETGQLRSEIGYERRGNVRIIKVIGGREQIAGYLQFGTNRMAAFFWFGLSKKAESKMRNYIDREWEKAIKKVA